MCTSPYFNPTDVSDVVSTDVNVSEMRERRGRERQGGQVIVPK